VHQVCFIYNIIHLSKRAAMSVILFVIFVIFITLMFNFFISVAYNIWNVCKHIRSYQKLGSSEHLMETWMLIVLASVDVCRPTNIWNPGLKSWSTFILFSILSFRETIYVLLTSLLLKMSEMGVHFSDLPTPEKVKEAYLKLLGVKIRLLYERYLKSGKSAFVTKCLSTHQTSTTKFILW
jgi:presenilin-like A22 family membrane protease